MAHFQGEELHIHSHSPFQCLEVKLSVKQANETWGKGNQKLLKMGYATLLTALKKSSVRALS